MRHPAGRGSEDQPDFAGGGALPGPGGSARRTARHAADSAGARSRRCHLPACGSTSASTSRLTVPIRAATHPPLPSSQAARTATRAPRAQLAMTSSGTTLAVLDGDDAKSRAWWAAQVVAAAEDALLILGGAAFLSFSFARIALQICRPSRNSVHLIASIRSQSTNVSEYLAALLRQKAAQVFFGSAFCIPRQRRARLM